ncbi:MAG: hypothetical protein RBR67_04910 [Desulfobacterium sp.]|nr:hypothetical protein [Desulfobacterium sp.]
MAKENDVVLIYLENTPVSFARVESIEPDVKRDWYHITLLMLQLPLETVTWTLKDLYINGDEFFMGGKAMRIEVVESPLSLEGEFKESGDRTSEGRKGSAQKEDLKKDAPPNSGGNVISLEDVRARKKKS